MTHSSETRHRNWRTALAGLLVVCAIATPLSGSLHVAAWYIGSLATAMVVACLLLWGRVERLMRADELPGVTLALAGDASAFGVFQSLGRSLRAMASNPDPIYRELAIDRLSRLSDEATALGAGRIEFRDTEAWRQAYEKLLRSRGLYRYQSVAYVQTPGYWQDAPGRQSMRVNYEMAGDGLIIERVVILPDAFWPLGEAEPVEPINAWIGGQLRAGIAVSLVRDSSLAAEHDLLTDFGIYGHRAVGFQQIDGHGSTVHFSLSFDFTEVLAAERRWDRLQVYATRLENPFGNHQQ